MNQDKEMDLVLDQYCILDLTKVRCMIGAKILDDLEVIGGIMR